MENRGFEDDFTCQVISGARESQSADRPWLVSSCNATQVGTSTELYLIREDPVRNLNGRDTTRKRWSLPDIGHQMFSFSETEDPPSVRIGERVPREHALTRVEVSVPDLALPTRLICSPGESDRYAEPSQTSWKVNSSLRTFKLVCLMRLDRMSRSLSNLLVTYTLIVFGAWALIYILFGESQAFPGGSIFGLIVLEVCSILLGKLVELVQLPGAVGMVAAGLILRNFDAINVVTDISPGLSGNLRAISIVILLSRGAIGVNGEAIRKYWRVVPGLAFGACVFEALVGSTAVYFIVQFPLEWSALMGCILSAMSGAIVLPYLVKIGSACDDDQKKLIVIAKTGCGLDAILAICMAEFALGFIFANGEVSGGLSKGVLEVVMGGAFGLLWGTVVGYLFDYSRSAKTQTFALFTGGVMGLLGLTKIGYPRGGPLGTFAGVLVSVTLWKTRKAEDSAEKNKIIQENFTFLWFLLQPLLFGIIGSRTDLSTVQWPIVFKGMACLAISLTGRSAIVFLLTSCDHLTLRQKLFLTLSWIPKGTVQAALGPVALDTALSLGFGPDTEALAYQVMNIAVATILLASIFGSLALLLGGRRLLTK
ncbi:unnamed protein product [Allacma fusca]|uniref:Cation/H+ exchanger domain-containing protein n=1 Tax=Allacma fusca TaxID=39272 RepID=A0A8J2LGQ3_9HEXA|nr:unnamed protein product [Allacma fusca]